MAFPLDQSRRGGMVINPESDLGLELRKWDTPRSQGGMRPDGYEEYPRMLYKAQAPNGKAEVHRMSPPRYAYPPGQVGDGEWTQACLMAEEFTKRCQTIVQNDDQKANMLSRGWCLTQDGALAAWKDEQDAIAKETAERLFRDQRMSPKAQAEADAVDRSTHEMVPDIVGSSRKTRGRPRKAKPIGA